MQSINGTHADPCFFFLNLFSLCTWFDILNSAEGGALKKCRARYGLDQQSQWCKPCRSANSIYIFLLMISNSWYKQCCLSLNIGIWSHDYQILILCYCCFQFHRRKKKCIRYLDPQDPPNNNHHDSEDNIGSVGSLEAPTPDSNRSATESDHDMHMIHSVASASSASISSLRSPLGFQLPHPDLYSTIVKWEKIEPLLINSSSPWSSFSSLAIPLPDTT